MIPGMLAKWLKKQVSLFLLLMAAGCLASALGRAVSGVAGNLLMPVAMAAALCGWLLGISHIKGRHAAGYLFLPGILGIVIYTTGLGAPIVALIPSAYSTITQIGHRLIERKTVDFTILNTTWSSFIQHIVGVLSRLSAWGGAVAEGKSAVDPVVTGLAWSVLLLMVGFWSGWQLGRNRQALRALAPGGLVLALVLDYTGKETGLLVGYLAIILILMGISRYDRLRLSWQRRGMDFSDSIAVDTMMAVVPLTVLLVVTAAITPSFSWQDMVERLRQANQGGNDHFVESLGLVNPQDADVYGSTGLARIQLVGLPPANSQELVFTISTGDIPPVPNLNVPIRAQRYYWRTMTYDVYTGSGWSSSPVKNTSHPARYPLMEIPSGYRVVRQQVRVVADQNERVYWTGTLIQADVDLEIAWRIPAPFDPSPARNGDMLGTLTNTSEYNVVSILPQVSIAELLAAGNDYPSEVSGSYLRLPESVPERVLVLAREIAGPSSKPYDRALAIQTYLRGFPYTLDVNPPPAGQDVVDYFLFTLHKGYCAYYASAMVVLSRAAGIPARIVFGYSSGTYNPTAAQYEVRQENAHAWPELYFPSIGWVEFEPTASQPEISRPVEIDQGLQPDLETASEIKPASRSNQWRSLIITITSRVILALLILAGGFVLWQAGEIWLLLLMPAPRAICSIYYRLEKKSQRLLPGLIRGHTPHELEVAFVHKVETMEKKKKGWFRPTPGIVTKEVGQIVTLFEILVFSPKAPERRQVRAGIKAWGHLRWKFRIPGGSLTLNKKAA